MCRCVGDPKICGVKIQLSYPECLCRSINDVEAKYYADGEDAYDMRKMLEPKKGGPAVLRLPKPQEKPPAPRPDHGAPQRLEGSQDAKASSGAAPDTAQGSVPTTEVPPPPPPPSRTTMGGAAELSDRDSVNGLTANATIHALLPNVSSGQIHRHFFLTCSACEAGDVAGKYVSWQGTQRLSQMNQKSRQI